MSYELCILQLVNVSFSGLTLRFYGEVTSHVIETRLYPKRTIHHLGKCVYFDDLGVLAGSGKLQC